MADDRIPMIRPIPRNSNRPIPMNSRTRTSEHLKPTPIANLMPLMPLMPEVGREKRISPKPSVEDLQDTSTEDLQCSLQSTLTVVFERYKKKDKLFYNIESELMKAREELKQVKQERNKTTEELKNTKQMLEQKIEQVRYLQTKNDQLEAEKTEKIEQVRDLQTKNDQLEAEKTEKIKEIDGLKKVLEKKDNAFNRFIKEFSGKEESCGRGELSSKEAGDVDGSSNCSICMEPWTESGEHNICSLSCGHFFGRSCITKWIYQRVPLGLSSCPQCLKTASLGDLRQHYVQQLCIGAEKKICADDEKIPQGRLSLMASRTVLSFAIESGQNNDLTNFNDEGPSGAGGDDISDGDDTNDNEESDSASENSNDDDDEDDSND